jgi:acyl-lipid omega-6 desaturase (Delta-12 desaturase)
MKTTDVTQSGPDDMAKGPLDPPSSSLPPASDGEPPSPTDVRRWRELLAPYAQPDTRRALICLATSVVPYLLLTALMWRLLSVSDLLVLALSIPASVFLVRTFIVFHDCSHGSFLHQRRANAWLGTGLGLLLYSPFLRWQHDHAVHHATSGDLDRRGVGDIRTLTVREYRTLPWKARLGYRLLRNPLVMFGVGPVVALIVGPRIVARNARPRMRRSVLATNAALAVIVGTLCWLIGWRGYLLVFGPSALLAGSIGIWLFYVQHQFEDVYWESGESWSYSEAALQGSSYLRLPMLLRLCTGNIGYHHLHHLDAKIPNYNLKRAHDENPVFHDVPTLDLADGLRAVRLKLWDEERGRLVPFSAVRGQPAQPSS